MQRSIRGAVAGMSVWVLTMTATASKASAQTPGTPCAGKPSADTAVYQPEALDILPKIRKNTPPRFSVMPELGTQLRVHVAFIVNQDGSVDPHSIHLIDSTRTAFDRDAERWIATLQFWPACREGEAVRAQLVQAVRYAHTPYSGWPPVL